MGKNRGRGSKKNKEDQADNLFSTLIKLKYLMYNDRVQCYTCDAVLHYRAIQCGHFVPRGNRATRWLEENGRPQCPKCNMELHGNLEEYAKRLDNEQEGLSERLIAISRETVHYSSSELDRLIIYLKKRIEECGGKGLIPTRY